MAVPIAQLQRVAELRRRSTEGFPGNDSRWLNSGRENALFLTAIDS
jgi:hypothetical protein